MANESTDPKENAGTETNPLTSFRTSNVVTQSLLGTQDIQVVVGAKVYIPYASMNNFPFETADTLTIGVRSGGIPGLAMGSEQYGGVVTGVGDVELKRAVLDKDGNNLGIIGIWRIHVSEEMEGVICQLEATQPDSQSDSGYTTGRIYLQQVQRITDSQQATLADAALIVRPAANRFIMDLGVTRTIQLTLKRTQPEAIDDSAGRSTQWSNEKWMQEFKLLIDRWQNYNRTADEEDMCGGMRFHYAPSNCPLGDDHADRGITIDANVFITGSVQFTAGFTLDLSLTLVVARMDVYNKPKWNICFSRKVGSSGMQYADSFVKSYLQTGTTAIQFPAIPESWTSDARGCDGLWHTTVTQEEGGTEKEADVTFKPSQEGNKTAYALSDKVFGDMTLETLLDLVDTLHVYAKIGRDSSTQMTYDTPGRQSVTCGSDAGQLTPGMYLIAMTGAGGGSCPHQPLDTAGASAHHWAYSTAGCGGEIIQKYIQLSAGDTMVIIVGEGGSAGTTGYANSGGMSEIIQTPSGGSAVVQMARGGCGGSYGVRNIVDGEVDYAFADEDEPDHTSVNRPSRKPGLHKNIAYVVGGCAPEPARIYGTVCQIPGFKDKKTSSASGDGQYGGGAGISGQSSSKPGYKGGDGYCAIRMVSE